MKKVQMQRLHVAVSFRSPQLAMGHAEQSLAWFCWVGVVNLHVP